MPRDFAPIHQDDESPLTLTRSPESQGSTPTTTSSNESAMHKGTSLQTSFQLRNRGGGNKELNDLHPYVQTLTIADLESCVALENAAFPEQERCSREKVGSCVMVFVVINHTVFFLVND